VAWPIIYSCCLPGTSASRINTIRSTIAKTRTGFDINSFRYPSLSDTELNAGAKLGLDSWADTGCAGRHAYVEEFIEGTSVNASGFSQSLGTIKNLPLANVLYAYDTLDGRTLILEHNDVIYLGDDMNDSLSNAIQSEEFGVRMDLRPKKYHGSEISCQTITLTDGSTLPVLYDGVLPFIPIRRPTPDEIQYCERYSLTSRDLWDPFSVEAGFSQASTADNFDLDTFILSLQSSDPISAELSCTTLAPFLTQQRIIEIPDWDDSEDNYDLHIGAVDSFKHSTLTPAELSQLWHIGLSTARRTLHATTHKCIRTTGLLTKRFKTDRSQLRYKQLSRRYGTFYTDFLKAGVKSVRQYVGGTLYTNKLGFKKFFPCTNETSEQTGQTFRSFIELVGLPASIHSDNHKNFKEGLFRRLLRKFGIFHTFTEPYSP